MIWENISCVGRRRYAPTISQPHTRTHITCKSAGKQATKRISMSSCLSTPVSVCLRLSPFVSVCLCVSLSLSLSLCLPACLSSRVYVSSTLNAKYALSPTVFPVAKDRRLFAAGVLLGRPRCGREPDVGPVLAYAARGLCRAGGGRVRSSGSVGVSEPQGGALGLWFVGVVAEA